MQNGRENQQEKRCLAGPEEWAEEWVFGPIRLMRLGPLLMTQTREQYVLNPGGFNPVLADNGSYLLLPWAHFHEENELLARRVTDRLHGICVLAGDDSRVYWTYRLLGDGTVVVLDEEGTYFHVTPHRQEPRAVKHRLGRAVLPSEEAYIDRLVRDLEERARMRRLAEEERRMAAQEKARRRRLKELAAAVPFRMGSKWGLRLADRLVVPPLYRQVLPPVGGYCAFEQGPGRWGVLAVDGRVVVEPRYASVTFCGRNRVRLMAVNGAVEVRKL